MEKVCIDVKSDFDWLVFSEDIDRERQTLRLVCQLSYWKALIYHLHLVQCTSCNKAACDKIFTSKGKSSRFNMKSPGRRSVGHEIDLL